MNITVDELLMETWLRAVNGCQIIQNHWTLSSSWNCEQGKGKEEIENRKRCAEALIKRHQKIKSRFVDTENNKNRSIDDFLKQTECDLIGVKYGLNEDEYYIIETAFHENGLHYTKNNREDNKRIYTKVLKGCLMFYIYVEPFINKNVKINLHLVFATPKASKALSKDDEDNEINSFLEDLKKGTKIKSLDLTVYANKSFEEQILKPVIACRDENGDEAELFTRSLKILDSVAPEILKEYPQKEETIKE